MSSTKTGFAVRQVDTPHGYAGNNNLNVNFDKLLPATTTGAVFTVTGSIVASLVGVVSTIFSATSVNISIGVTNKTTALAAFPAAGIGAIVVGRVFKLPALLGGQLPVSLLASSTAVGSPLFTVSNTAITVTTDATNTGHVTWLLVWESLGPKRNASVANN